ncbi:MAG: chromosome segregation protein SMC [Streptosporangiales bacterium]|nr:chromosome segregation protein SMC [Streptosporangiales bacterium]
MYLKSLTLRGFKSFASSTTLQLEPGITCVVGPNGSGKSNVVDALAWVMGEQGAKSLRGGKMEDVIFAGTAGRPPLGRAEVMLTIDNTDGALPIEYAEVTISRLMFRSGQSEYSINGNPARLLDVQELLSDSGIGREMHVIVGQGQLDQVVLATPEDRRGFIEEAAGVLKHRKRKEKALRKLDAMQANLTRVSDLTAEIRRQLKPLGKQAEVARKAAAIQADVRDAKLRLLADDLVTLRTQLEQEVADEAATKQRRQTVEAQLGAAQRREAELEEQEREAAPYLNRTQEVWYRLTSLRERFRGTAGLAAERVRHLAEEPEEEGSGQDPDALEAEAREVREREAGLHAELETAQEALADAVDRRAATESSLDEEEKRVAGAQRAAADRREGLVKLRGEVQAMRSRASAAAAEIGRLSTSLEDAKHRAEQARQEYAAIEGTVVGLDEGEVDLDAQHEQAVLAHEAAQQRVQELQQEVQEAERDRAAHTARKEALELGLARKDGAGALLAASDEVSGLLGTVAALVTVRAGAETAVAAALGAAADAVAVDSVASASAALSWLKDGDAGRADVLVGSGEGAARSGWPEPPAGAQYAYDLVDCPDTMRPALAGVLDRVVVVDDLASARQLVEAGAVVDAVTRSGDLLGRHRARGGSESTQSLIEVQAAVDEATEQLHEAQHRGERATFALTSAREELTATERAVEEALDRLHESDAQLSAVTEQLAQLGSSARAATAEAERLERSIETAEEARDHDLSGLAELEERLTAAEELPDEDDELDTGYRDRLRTTVETARSAEMEARLAVRTAEERVRALRGRADQLERAAVAERAARERAVRRRERRRQEAAVAEAVEHGANYALACIELSLARAAEEREAAERARTAREGEFKALRATIRDLTGELDKLTDVMHGTELARTEQRARIEQLEQKALDELGIEVGALVSEYGPDCPVPQVDENGEQAEPIMYDRKAQEKRLKAAERQLSLLGKVNPLALEEYAALEERHQFLSEQLEDLKATRRDLLTVVQEVDERIEQVFRSAYEDTEREFQNVFSRLFPGGEGRLVLTEPNDMLTTGVEVEARPPGKKVKRLSLLSGGERSLVAIAMLVAIFKARPSPFYILDEVEAALDDTNLRRLLGILEELRESSQLVVITHQKPTMEIADSLYGVSMRGDGVTSLISQRMREAEAV